MAQLSRREREVAALVAEGLTNREIATRLFISERTVDGHLEHIREKLGVSSRAQVAAWVVRQGAAEPVVSAPASSRPIRRPVLVAHPRAWIAAALVLALLAAAVGVLRLTAPPEATIEIVAGIQPRSEGPDGSYTGDKQRAIDAGLSRPSAVVVRSDGAMFIADFGNSVIREVVGGVIDTVAGGGTNPLAEGAVAIDTALESPSAIALDSSGRLYFLEARSDAIEVWTWHSSEVQRVALLGRSRPVSPTSYRVPIGGLAIAADGTMYVADWAENQVWKVKPDGQQSIYAGNRASGCSGDGGAATDATLRGPMGLALDRSGNLYIADTGNNTIREVDTQGIITTIAGRSGACDLYAYGGDGGPATQARLAFPFGLAVARDGTIYIADTGNNRIREITRAGTILTLAGTGLPGYWGDGGPAIDANLKAPEAVWLEPNGNLLIADSGNHRIREVRGLSR